MDGLGHDKLFGSAVESFLFGLQNPSPSSAKTFEARFEIPATNSRKTPGCKRSTLTEIIMEVENHCLSRKMVIQGAMFLFHVFQGV